MLINPDIPPTLEARVTCVFAARTLPAMEVESPAAIGAVIPPVAAAAVRPAIVATAPKAEE